MPSRNWKLRIQDILDSIVIVQNYVSNMTYEDFIKDWRTIDAVVRRFIIIGEAAHHVPEDICQRHPEIPWPEMRAMRNLVVHEYFGVSEKILWDTIQSDLPAVVEPLKRLIETESAPNE